MEMKVLRVKKAWVVGMWIRGWERRSGRGGCEVEEVRGRVWWAGRRWDRIWARSSGGRSKKRWKEDIRWARVAVAGSMMSRDTTSLAFGLFLKLGVGSGYWRGFADLARDCDSRGRGVAAGRCEAFTGGHVTAANPGVGARIIWPPLGRCLPSTCPRILGANRCLEIMSHELDFALPAVPADQRPPYPLNIRQVEPATSIRAADPLQSTVFPSLPPRPPGCKQKTPIPHFGHAGRRKEQIVYVTYSVALSGLAISYMNLKEAGIFLSGGSKDGGSSYTNAFTQEKRNRV